MIRVKIDGGINPSQQALLDATDRNVLFSGGYGSGKTFGGALKTLQMVQANDADGLIVAPTYSHLFSISVAQVFDVMKRLGLGKHTPAIRDKQHERYLDFGFGGKVYLRSADNPGSLEGLNVGWAWLDEARLISEEAKNIAKGRVRVPCARSQIFYTSTPALGWLYDEFMTGKPERQIIRAHTSENERNLGEGFVEDLRFSYSRRLQDAVIAGEFTVLDGAVYDEFDPSPETSPWIVPYSPIPFPQRKVILGVDPGYRYSSWHLWHEVKARHWIMFDQMQFESMSTESCVDAINQAGYTIDEAWIDPAADSTEQATAMDSLSYLSALRWRTKPNINMIVSPWRDLVWSVDKVRAMLGRRSDKDHRIQFSTRVLDAERGKKRGIIKALSGYRYHPQRADRPVTNIPLKDGVHDHDADAFRYFVVGKVLSEPSIRMRDRDLAASRDLGYKRAA